MVLINGTNQNIHIIDLQKSVEIGNIFLDGDGYNAFFLSPNNKYLFIQSYDYVLSVYDIAAQKYTMSTKTADRTITDWKFEDNGNKMILQETPYRSLSSSGVYSYKQKEPGVYELYSDIGICDQIINNKGFLLNSGIYEFETLSLDELLIKTDEVLNGRELNDLERQKYAVD